MCLIIFIGSDVQLPEIEWDETSPNFHVKLAECDEATNILAKRHKYYVGVSSGCGCGFYYDDAIWEERQNKKERRERLDQFAELKKYLMEIVKGGDVELLAFWSDVDDSVVSRTILAKEFEMPVLSDTWHNAKTMIVTIKGG